MTQMYYRNASAAIICFDLTDLDSFKRVDYWLRQLRQFEQSCRVFLCGTKLDLLENEEKDYATDNILFYQANDQVLKNKLENNSINNPINEEEIEVYCKHNDIINYLPTSSKSGYNVDEIFQGKYKIDIK
jgi:Ras-related protein Rab-24